MADAPKPLTPQENSDACSNRGPALSISEARSKHFSDLAKRPRKPRRFSPKVGRNTPPWMKALLDEVGRMARHPLLVAPREAHEAELKAAGLRPAPALIEALVTLYAKWELARAALLNIRGGLANRGRRELYRLAAQADECLSAYLSMRSRLGLDADTAALDGESILTAVSSSLSKAAAAGPKHFSENFSTNAAYALALRGNIASMQRDLAIVERRDPAAKPVPPDPQESPPPPALLPAPEPAPPAAETAEPSASPGAPEVVSSTPPAARDVTPPLLPSGRRPRPDDVRVYDTSRAGAPASKGALVLGLDGKLRWPWE